jgi:hypothetical protein
MKLAYSQLFLLLQVMMYVHKMLLILENHIILGMQLISEGGLYSGKNSNSIIIKSPHTAVTASFKYQHWFLATLNCIDTDVTIWQWSEFAIHGLCQHQQSFLILQLILERYCLIVA